MEERQEELHEDDGAAGAADGPGEDPRPEAGLGTAATDEGATAAAGSGSAAEPDAAADFDATDELPLPENDSDEPENPSETVDVGTDPGASEEEPETVDVGTDPGATEDEPAIEEQKDERAGRSWVPWAVGVPIVVALAVAVVLLLENVDLGGGRERHRLDQPGWRITAYSVGSRFLGDADRKVSPKVRRDLVTIVKTVHNTMFLAPHRVQKVARQYFLSEAAKALTKSKVGIPRAAREVKIVSRRARIGVDAAGQSRAAALVNIVARGRAGGKEFGSATESRLWLERGDGGWKVIAFQVDQHPVKVRRPGRGGDDGKDGKKDKKVEPGDKSKKEAGS